MPKKPMKEILSKAGWCCINCGEKYGRKRTTESTWHVGTCDVCGNTDVVTETRDFNNLRK
jgi:hypothetical protein